MCPGRGAPSPPMHKDVVRGRRAPVHRNRNHPPHVCGVCDCSCARVYDECVYYRARVYDVCMCVQSIRANVTS